MALMCELTEPGKIPIGDRSDPTDATAETCPVLVPSDEVGNYQQDSFVLMLAILTFAQKILDKKPEK